MFKGKKTVATVPDNETLPFSGDEDGDRKKTDSKDVRALVRQILGEIDCLRYLKSLRYKAFPKSDLRVYVYEDVDAKKIPKSVTLFNLETGKQVPTEGGGLPPEKFAFRTNRWVFRDTAVCLCKSKPIKQRGKDHALAFSGVGDEGRALCTLVEFYDLITNPDDDFEPKYLMEHCDDSVTMKRALEIGEKLQATTFVEWVKNRQCMKHARPDSIN
jgi:hypothetical protein